MTPDELIEERKRNLREEDPEVRNRVERLLHKYSRHLKEKGVSGNARRSYVVAVKSFFEKNYSPLNFKQRIRQRNRYLNNAATRQQVFKMLQVSNTRDRAIMLTMAQSGLAASDICSLTYGDIKKDFEAEITPCNIHKIRRKTGEEINTFITSQATDAIKLHLNERRKGTPYVAPETIEDNSPLFKSSGKTHNEIRHITPNNFNHLVITKAAKKAGLYNGNRSLTSHSLRRFFQTTLEFASVPHNWIKLMMGHSLPETEGAYSKPTTEQLREMYQKATPLLLISSEMELEAIKQSRKIQQLEETVRILEHENLKLKQRLNGFTLSSDQVQELLRRIEKLEKQAQKQT